MSTKFTSRPTLTVALLSLAACGGGLDARAESLHASSAVAVEQPGPRDRCGTSERPCLLQEIRVDGSAAE